MDIRLFAAVMSRFKKIAIAGFVAAIVFSGLAYLRLGASPKWEAQAEVLITQPNDPYGAPTSAAVQASSYLGSLSSVYAAMANGDAVQAMVRRAARVPHGTVDAAEVADPHTGYPEPLITLTSKAPSATGAVNLAQKMPVVLQKYIASQQDSANVPSGLRVQLDQVESGSLPELASGNSLTVPLLVFMGVMAAVITLIFMLENVNPKTAEKLGRDNMRTSLAHGGNSELAAVIAALVRSQHSATGTDHAHPGTPLGNGGGPHATMGSVHSANGLHASSGAAGSAGPQSIGANPAREPLRRLIRGRRLE